MNDASPEMMSIFHAALERLTPEERADYLDATCGPDVALRQRIEALLRAHEQAEGFLEARSEVPAPRATVDQPPTSERPGVVLADRYKLLQQIGEGGMGTVFMAEQTHPVQRKVAVKVIKAGMDSRQVIARFEAERQALALMDHVNIARVVDAGATESGRPYFVMELVHGVPITQYCDDNHLTPRQRLELFVPVCQAIQHAHQKGIIHRDIKPSNVMITLYDGKPVPKVIDFGVAKATEQKLTERTLFTQYGTLVGTLEYMSPEQAEMSALGVDTRSDIYSLGVLLYELLTGSTPLSHKRVREAAYAEILRMIREDEPPRPSTRLSDSGEALASISAQRHMEPARLTKLVRGELDWIVMKTLEKDRNRRYETASGFAMDVQRYLNDEPVQACPPAAGYRLRKFARRNKRALAMVAVAAASVLIAATSFGWSVRDRQARQRDASLEAARRLAVTEQGIRQALDRGTKSSADLHAILKKPGGVQQLLNQPGRWDLSIKTAQGELAQSRRLAVHTEGSLGAESTQAMNRLEQQLTSDQADYDLALRLEKIRMDRATWVEGSFDFRTAADEYPKAFASSAVLTDDPAAVAARLGSSPIKDQLVAALDDWASVASTLRKHELVERLLAVARQVAPDPAWGDRSRQLKVWFNREALGKLAAEAPADGLSPQLLHLVGSLLHDDKQLMESWLRRAQAEHRADFWLSFSLANALLKTNSVEAAGFYRVALAVRPANSAALTNLGKALELQDKLPEAIATFRKAIEIDPRHAIAYSALGVALRKQGRLDEAIACYRKAIEIDPKLVSAHGGLGQVRKAQGKLDEAIACHRKAIEIDPKSTVGHCNLGSALRAQGKLDEAIVCYRDAIELDPKFADAYFGLGNVLLAQKTLDKAIAAFRKAIELDPKLADAHNNLGNALFDQKKLDEAVTAYRKAIELNPKLAFAHNGLGNALFQQNKLDEAIACLRRAIELDPKLAFAHNGLGNALTQQNKLDEAIAVFRKAIEIDPKYANAHNGLGNALLRQKKLDEAITAYRRAIELDPKLPNAHNNLGNALSDQKKLDEAITAYRMAIEHNPKLAIAHNGLGNALSRQKKLDEAIACLRRGIELDPKLAIAHYNLGKPLKAQGKLDEAIAAYQKAIDVEPKLVEAHIALGNILRDQGKLDEASAYYRRAIEIDPKSADAHYSLGSALFDQKKLDEAITAYRKAIELDPKSPWTKNYTRKALVDALGKKSWELANCPDPKIRDTRRAIELSLEAIEVAPETSRTWQFLGWAQYRAGNWKASIEALEKSCKLQNPGDRGQWIVMSLAHGKLANEKDLPEQERDRHKTEASRWYDQAANQIDSAIGRGEHVGQDIRAFRVEAAGLLGVKEKQK